MYFMLTSNNTQYFEPVSPILLLSMFTTSQISSLKFVREFYFIYFHRLVLLCCTLYSVH